MDAQEDVLREILGARPVLHRAGDQGEDQVLVPVDQLLEGALVAAAAALDELALVDGLHQPLVLEHAGGQNVSVTGLKHLTRQSGLIP